MQSLRRIAAYIVLTSVYGLTWLAAAVGAVLPRRPWKPNGRIIVTGTFHNPNWFVSHVMPLVRSGAQELILVVDEPQLPLERVRFVCPPRWAAKLLSRAGAKAIWMILAGVRYRPDLYMGYHLAPGACTALVVGKLLGRPACYQMTGGPVEVIGGGVGAAESVGSLLGRPSGLIESMALSVVRSFDLVVVRGSKARDFLMDHGVRGAIGVITGSVQNGSRLPEGERDIHLVFTGRLAPVKQVHQFIAVVEEVSRTIPSVRAAVVGDGPLMEDMVAMAERRGVSRNITFLGKREDVDSILARSKVFVLTSQSEGLSIALAEAMAAGVVPVVADVGELGDLVVNGVNGYLISPNCVPEYVEMAVTLLNDRGEWERLSRSAAEAARERCGLDVIARKWQEHLRGVIDAAADVGPQEVMN